MATTIDMQSDSIDPSTIELPADFAERIRTVFDLESTPQTYGDWGTQIVESFEAGHARTLSTEDLCDTADSPHSATVDGETTHYICAQDPLIVGMLAEQPVTVQSKPPNRNTPITIEFGADGSITADPDGALLSFGVAAEAEGPDHVTPESMYGLVCPYGHAFPDDEAYQEWAAETDAVTDVLSVPAGIAVMRELVAAGGVEDLE